MLNKIINTKVNIKVLGNFLPRTLNKGEGVILNEYKYNFDAFI